jgi:hypothetical protein
MNFVVEIEAVAGREEHQAALIKLRLIAAVQRPPLLAKSALIPAIARDQSLVFSHYCFLLLRIGVVVVCGARIVRFASIKRISSR